MNSMNVGRVYSTTMNQPSGITEVLLEKTQRERDHYKFALEEISTSVDDWLNSLIQEPSLDFIHAIKAWADKKLKEIVYMNDIPLTNNIAHGNHVVPTEFAQDLERERNEARAIAKYWQEQFGHSNPEHEWQSFPWEAAK